MLTPLTTISGLPSPEITSADVVYVVGGLGLLVAAVGPVASLFVNAATFAISAALTWALVPAPDPVRTGSPDSAAVGPPADDPVRIGSPDSRHDHPATTAAPPVGPTDRTTGDTQFILPDVPHARDRREGLRGLVERARARRGVREIDLDDGTAFTG